MEEVLIVPGLRNSGPTHWQTWLGYVLPATRRVEQDDWERTCLSDWTARVRQAIDESAGPLWIVAHSFGCLASVTAGFTRPDRIRGALLVAPADPERFGEPLALLEEKLAFPSLVVASSNDPWVKSSAAEYWAGQWGSAYLNIGEAGHINVDSGHGPWPQGLQLFEAFRARVEASGSALTA
jgi:predicted alpha/beta hydrolase family esterase